MKALYYVARTAQSFKILNQAQSGMMFRGSTIDCV
jgi:hypothetical protein